MLPTSMRRVVATTPQSPVVSSLVASSAPRAASFRLRCSQSGHQRRYSSSKPNRSGDSPAKELAARQSAPSSSSEQKQARPAAKPTGDKRRRKVQDDGKYPSTNLPSVPSTHAMSPEALGLSTFFSLHRPISIKQSLPKAVSQDRFAEIFAERSQSRKTRDTIRTVSRAIHGLEQPMSQLHLNGEDADLNADFDGGVVPARIDLRHPDGSETSLYLKLNTMTGDFLPFRPPPLPQPLGASAAAAEQIGPPADAEAGGTPGEHEPSTRRYKAILTIEERLESDGSCKVTAHSPTILDDDAGPRTFLERMVLRQLQWEEWRRRRGATILALSVRRQKKLKMKKKKYKKLMRRTRNERRKLQKV